MQAKATKHKLKEFFILGLFKTYAAKILEKMPKSAVMDLATPSNQKATSSNIFNWSLV